MTCNPLIGVFSFCATALHLLRPKHPHGSQSECVASWFLKLSSYFLSESKARQVPYTFTNERHAVTHSVLTVSSQMGPTNTNPSRLRKSFGRGLAFLGVGTLANQAIAAYAQRQALQVGTTSYRMNEELLKARTACMKGRQALQAGVGRADRAARLSIVQGPSRCHSWNGICHES